MKNEYLVDIKILENNSKTIGGLIIIDKLTKISVKDAIEILTTKYEPKKTKKEYKVLEKEISKLIT